MTDKKLAEFTAGFPADALPTLERLAMRAGYADGTGQAGISTMINQAVPRALDHLNTICDMVELQATGKGKLKW